MDSTAGTRPERVDQDRKRAPCPTPSDSFLNRRMPTRRPIQVIRLDEILVFSDEVPLPVVVAANTDG
ncbi:MAG: hypothetical protein DWH81_11605 [Planctomycetota bacterium]|nr:MAG: hypothetical protein DWH81_11605 [Planctomycetota bacterium]